MSMLSRLKALTGRVKFPGRSLILFDTTRDATSTIQRKVGDGTSSDILMTPIRWLQRSIVEAPWAIKDAKGEPIEDSDLLALLNAPNPFYSGDILLAGTVLSLSLDGNGYWIVADNADSRPCELWYAPHLNMEPKWPSQDNTKFITHYEYNVAGQKQLIKPMGADPDDVHPEVVEGLSVIHFRDGVDLDNLRKGLSPLKGLLREVWTDNEAAAFTASLLKNNGVPGVIVSPSDPNATLTPEQGEAAQAKIDEYRGEGRGKTIVMLGPTRVEQFGFNPKQLDLGPLRNISEERVCAALGTPAAVVGFGAGLQQTSVGATMKELRQLAWTNGVIPHQRRIEGGVTRQLAPAFDVAKAEFNNQGVEALRENQDTRANRIERLVRSMILTRAEGRTELGFESQPSDEVYLMSLAIIEVPQGQVQRPPTLTEPSKTDHWAAAYLKHSHGATEDRIIAAAPKAPPTQTAIALAKRLDTIRIRTGKLMQDPLERVFEDLGRSALAAAKDFLKGLTIEDTKQVGGELGLGPIDIVLAERIVEATDTAAAQVALQEAFEAGYATAASDTSSAIGRTFGTTFQLTDEAQLNVLREGGLRSGLIDLSDQTRDSVFQALEEGRKQGLSSDNLARHIADNVKAGPWRDAATRARVIARTEGAHAANTSTLQAARSMPKTEHVQVFDNRGGGRADEACLTADGAIITIDEADAIGLAHPNCTRGFVPINALLMQEMGL
jgi:HK97 family phage portal protein